MIEVREYIGLIRNHSELATELGIKTEGLTRLQREHRIVVEAYRTWGASMGLHINGQFAIALYDDETHELFCTRDPLGAELLFYYETTDGRLLVATEIADLLTQDGFACELNRELVQFYLGFTYIPGEDTLFKGVHKLEPGGYLVFGEKGLKLGRYWELSFEPDDSKTLEDWADEIECAMAASLSDICDEGEATDSFLSGGVDSSYILAMSKAHKGICVAYEHQAASEEAEARETATWLGRGFQGVSVTPEDLFGSVDEFLLSYEQPSADIAGLSLFTACKKVAGTSNICFSGEGADEFFAGYSVYKRVKRLNAGLDPVYFGTTHIMNEAEQRRYLKEFYPECSARDFMRERGREGRAYDPLSWMVYTDLRSYFEGSILFNSTRIARGTGLDIRMPYCDLRIFDISRRMPSRFKVSGEGNKLALRAAASRVLPHDVAYRKKLGFPVPVRAWLAEPGSIKELRRAFESESAAEFFNVREIGALLDAFEGDKPRVSHPIWFARHQALLWRHIWTIYLFIRWHELFFSDAAPRGGVESD